jgi:hypothetical protein
MLAPVYAFNKTYSTHMKTKIVLFLATVLFFVAIFSACKKENSNPKTDESTEIAVQSDDQSRFSNEIDAVATDADFSIENSPTFTGRLMRGQGDTLCSATASYDLVNKKITITYDGASCTGDRTRTGTVVLSMAPNAQWKNAGAFFTIQFQNLKITRLSDNKSITINGTQTYTNVSGHLLMDLINPQSGIHSITHAITSDDMTITFDDGTQRSWHIAKQRVYAASIVNNAISGSVTISGTHTEGSVTNIAEWGTNRLGRAFTSATLQPVVIRSDCNFRVVSGEIKHSLPNVSADATFGLDASGNPTTCPGTGHYYFKIVFTGSGGNSITLIMPY